jgi:hypothetical protein
MDESSVADYPQPGTSTQHTALMRTKSELAAVRDFSRTDDASASQAAARRSAVPALVALARAAHRFLRLLGSSHGLRYSAWSPLWLALVEVVTAGAIGLCAQEVGARICVRHLRPNIVHVILTYPTEKWDLRTGKVAWML